jgi:hypothetical protein
LSIQHSAISTQQAKSNFNSEEMWMKNFRDLKVWHKAHQLTLETYRRTAKFPAYEAVTEVKRMLAALLTTVGESKSKGQSAGQ